MKTLIIIAPLLMSVTPFPHPVGFCNGNPLGFAYPSEEEWAAARVEWCADVHNDVEAAFCKRFGL